VKSEHLQEWEASIEGAFTGNIVLPECGGSYTAKLGFVTFLSLVPVVFYLVVMAVGFYHYLFYAITLFPGFNFYGGGYTSLYIIGLILVTVLLIFLSRPLFNVISDKKLMLLSEEQEPVIYLFANILAQKMGVDPVEKIALSSEVLVDAYYESPRDFYEGKLTLEVGLPLISTLSLTEITALIAHEYGHYAQKQIKICYFIIRNVHGWFYRVIQGEDGWENRLESLREERPKRLMEFVTLPVVFGISAITKVFRVFSSALELVSSQLIFDTELHADQIQAQILGSDSFDRSLKHLVQVDQCYHAALEKIFSGEIQPVNISDLVYSLYEKNPLQSDQFIEMARSDRFNSWHFLPPPSSRTRHVKNLQQNSIFSLEKPTVSLFSNVEEYAQRITLSLYEDHDIKADTNMQAAELDERDRPVQLEKEEALLRRFTSGLYRRDMVWEFPEVDKFEHLSEEKIEPFLNKVVVSIRHSLPEFNKYVDLVEEYKKISVQYHFYQWLIKDGSKSRPDGSVINELKHSIEEFESKYKNSKVTYCKFYGVRVAAAVALGRDSKAYNSATKLIVMLSKLSFLQVQVCDAKIKCSTLEKLIVRRAEGDTMHQKTISRLTRMMLKVIENMERITGRFPASLLGEVDVDIVGTRLHLEELNGADYEKLVADRFHELVRYYEGFNTAISAKLAQFVEMVERKQNIESVATVSLDDSEDAA